MSEPCGWGGGPRHAGYLANMNRGVHSPLPQPPSTATFQTHPKEQQLKKILAIALISSLGSGLHAQAQSSGVELLNNMDAIRARASLASGVPEDVVRAAYPNAFPKYGPTGGAAGAANNCDTLASDSKVQAEIKSKLSDPVEPLNALADTPESSRSRESKPYYFYLRDIYERGNLAEQVHVKSSWQPNGAVVRDYLKNGISCEVAVKVKMNGTVQLNKSYRGRKDDGDIRPVIPVDLIYLSVYEVKGVKQASGETTIQVRGLKRLYN